MVDYRPEKKSIRDYYKEFMGKGDEVGRDQRRRRYKRIRTQKETKRIKEQTQDLKKDIYDNTTNSKTQIDLLISEIH